MVENFIYHNYKKNAEKELLEIENKTKKATSHIRFIVNDYPDFNHIALKIYYPNHFELRICLNIDDLKDNPKAIHKAAKMCSGWIKAGGIKE